MPEGNKNKPTKNKPVKLKVSKLTSEEKEIALKNEEVHPYAARAIIRLRDVYNKNEDAKREKKARPVFEDKELIEYIENSSKYAGIGIDRQYNEIINIYTFLIISNIEVDVENGKWQMYFRAVKYMDEFEKYSKNLKAYMNSRKDNNTIPSEPVGLKLLPEHIPGILYVLDIWNTNGSKYKSALKVFSVWIHEYREKEPINVDVIYDLCYLSIVLKKIRVKAQKEYYSQCSKKSAAGNSNIVSEWHEWLNTKPKKGKGTATIKQRIEKESENKVRLIKEECDKHPEYFEVAPIILEVDGFIQNIRERLNVLGKRIVKESVNLGKRHWKGKFKIYQKEEEDFQKKISAIVKEMQEIEGLINK